MNEKVIEISRLSKRFNDTMAVQDIRVVFFKGEYVCILGPSGCGKTTLLRLIAGFENPDSGEILLEGKTLSHVPPEQRNINMVFQNYALFPHMTVFNNIAFGLKMKKIPGELIAQRVTAVLQMVNLARYADRYPRQLSGGEQQRVALARALVNRPLVLLLDEPLGALDKNMRLEMQEELKKIQRETGITFLHVTHDQEEALTMADRLVIMNEGQFVQVGRAEELYNQPNSRFAAEFLGTSNIFAGRVTTENPSLILLEDNIRLYLENALEGMEGRKIDFFIRPERIKLCNPQTHHTNVLAGKILQVKFIGSTSEYLVESGPVTIKVKTLAPGETKTLQPGSMVSVYLDPTHIVPLLG